MDSVRLYRLGLRWVPRLPRQLLYALADGAGWLMLAAPGLRHAVLRNLRHVLPSAPVWQRWRTAGQLVGLVLRSYVDLLALPTTSAQELAAQFEISGTEYLDVILERGEGGMMAVPHCGSWSAVLAALMQRGYPLVLIVEPIQPPELLELVSDLRRTHGLEVLPLGIEAARTMLRALKANRIVVLAGDRDLATQALMVPFFDAPAPVPAGPGALAARGIPVVTAFTAWVHGDRKIARIDPLPGLARQPAETADAATLRATRAILARFEAYIRAFPASWGVLQSIWPPMEDHRDHS